MNDSSSTIIKESAFITCFSYGAYNLSKSLTDGSYFTITMIWTVRPLKFTVNQLALDSVYYT